MQKPMLKMAETSNGCMESSHLYNFLNPHIKWEGGVLSLFSPVYNHLKDDSNRNQRIREGDFKRGFQKNINYSA